MAPQGWQIFQQSSDLCHLPFLERRWWGEGTKPVALDEIGVAGLGVFAELCEARLDEGLARIDARVLSLLSCPPGAPARTMLAQTLRRDP
jgi:hypothetical protein